MKPLKVKNYGSIGHLPNSKLGETDRYINEGQVAMCTAKKKHPKDVVYVTEKYDGSNVGICKKNGKIWFLTRSGNLAKESQFSIHHDFYEWAEKLYKYWEYKLDEGERIVGEWVKQRLSIEYLISTPFIAFDFFNQNNKRYPFSYLNDVFNDGQTKIARLIHEGEPVSVESLLTRLNMKSPFCASVNEHPEGMVYKIERDGKFIMNAKWVRQDFEAGKYLDKVIYNSSK